MHPILFEIGGFELKSFGVMVMLGVLAGSWWLGRALQRLGVADRDATGDLITVSILLGFLGARLMYLAVHPEAFHAWYSPIALWEGGIVSYGGFFGGALGAILWARRRRVSIPKLGDAMLPALFLGQTFGRIGCFLVGDDYGRPWDGPWAVAFPDIEGSLMPRDLLGVPLHPTQLYLSGMDLVIFLLMAWLFARRRFDGQVMTVTMALYAVGRFLVEFTRGDDEARGIYGRFSTAQWISIVLLPLAIVLYVRFRSGARAAAEAHAPAHA
jgi:phosphatidylglycerol---prolipoprotein diacylglyceryl transferase